MNQNIQKMDELVYLGWNQVDTFGNELSDGQKRLQQFFKYPQCILIMAASEHMHMNLYLACTQECTSTCTLL